MSALYQRHEGLCTRAIDGIGLVALAFGGAHATGGVVWLALRILQGTLLQWGGLWGDYWVPNLIGVSIAALIFVFGLLRLGGWLRNTA